MSLGHTTYPATRLSVFVTGFEFLVALTYWHTLVVDEKTEK
jgi:hypothetical protein